MLLYEKKAAAGERHARAELRGAMARAAHKMLL